MAIRSIPLHTNKISWVGLRHSFSTCRNIDIANPPETEPTLGIALMDQFACAAVGRLSKRNGWHWFCDANTPALSDSPLAIIS